MMDMPLDRYVRFSTKRPTQETLEKVLTQFFGNAASITWAFDRFIVDLPGNHSWALNGVLYDREQAVPPIRTIEVIMEPSGAFVNVYTHHQDEFTNGVAFTLQNLLCRAWI